MIDRRRHRLGQIFLINRDIAGIEAEHGRGKRVLEIGPGPGMLTEELCRVAKRVVAVEKDRALYADLKMRLASKKLTLMNKDFFDASDDELMAEDTDIVIANVPYSLSSKIVGWLAEHRMQAVLCLQKEFVDHMMAKPDTSDYSRLSVVTALSFRVTRIYEVARGSFRPVPKVDSTIIYMKPLGQRITPEESRIIGAIMQHKKKRLKNAISDSEGQLGLSKSEAVTIAGALDDANARVFKLTPDRLLAIARTIAVHSNENDSS